MKICLVDYPVLEPSSPETNSGFHIGILSLAALLEKAGHQVVIVDPYLEFRLERFTAATRRDPVLLGKEIEVYQPDLVGFSTVCNPYPRVLEWARGVRALCPGTPILLGGPQATASDVETLRAFPWVDLILRGEAENSILPLVDCLEGGADLAGVPSLTWRQGGEVRRNPDAPLILDLDSLPRPAYHLYPMAEFMVVREKDESVSLEAGRGCPCRCTFCSTGPFFGRRYRIKSPRRLADEMLDLYNLYGVTSFSLEHDLFTANKEYVRAFCKSLREKELYRRLEWGCFIRADTVDEELLREMAAAGCAAVFVGVESGSPRIQKLIHKKLDLGRTRAVVGAALAHGMMVKPGMIVGFPQEREADLGQTLALTLDFIQMGVQAIQFLVVVPLVGSELHGQYGHTLRSDSFQANLYYPDLTPEEQQMVRDHPSIFASFYHFETPHLNPHSLYAMVSAVHGLPDLLIALREAGADLLSLFRRWGEVHQHYLSSAGEYYQLRNRFRPAFYRFLRDTLAGDPATAPGVVDLIKARFRSLETEKMVVGKATIDPQFRQRLLAEPDQALAGYDLAQEEMDALKALDASFFEDLAGVFDRFITKVKETP